MKKHILLCTILCALFVAIFGTLGHFFYQWSDNNRYVGFFFAVNESTWEHMKLLYFPMLIFALIQNKFFEEHENFWCVKLVGILTGLALIPILFYTYNGAIGKSPDLVNILIFFISVTVAYFVETRLFIKLFREDISWCKNPLLAYSLICLIGVLFVVFTFSPPELPLFMDPQA